MEAVGALPRVGGTELPGASLFALANGLEPERPVISEYHAIGSVAGGYMLRYDRFIGGASKTSTGGKSLLPACSAVASSRSACRLKYSS